MPTGFSTLPPSGPAMPVIASARSTPARSRAPRAMCSATGALTAPCAAISASLTPSSSTFEAFE